MAQPLQKPGISQTLREYFGVRGKFPLELDPTVVPTAQVIDLHDSPYAFQGGGFENLNAGGAANPTQCVLVPGPTAILVIHVLTIYNGGAGANVAGIGIADAAQVATAVAAGGANTIFSKNDYAFSSTALAKVPALYYANTGIGYTQYQRRHVGPGGTVTLGRNNGQLGNFVIRGDDPAGQQGFVVDLGGAFDSADFCIDFEVWPSPNS